MLKAHQQERVPATPLVATFVSARTVLAGEGPLRRAEDGAPLPAPLLSGYSAYATCAPAGTLHGLHAQTQFAELDLHNWSLPAPE
jgi:hypothetical protein